MKYKLFLTFICMFILSSVAFTQTACKVNFCNCCSDSEFYLIRDLSGTVIGSFWTNSDGCTHVNPGINLNSGQSYYITQDCSDNAMYFTACVCNEGTQTIKIPCNCPLDEPYIKNTPRLGEAPNKFELFQNYPNPFNPSTKIQFAIPVETNVKLTIYDVSGREVTILFNSLASVGYHEINWNASTMANGVYFYKLEAGKFTDEKKMILLK